MKISKNVCYSAVASLCIGASLAMIPVSTAQASISYASAYSSKANAVARAKSYLSYTAFSRAGLIKQLRFEKFSLSDATYAVDHIKVDWRVQAVRKGKQYLTYSAFSKEGLRKQLAFEQFTKDQVDYAIRQLFPKPKTIAPQKPASGESKVSYNKTFDICSDYSGSGVSTLVSKGTSCSFASNVINKYETIMNGGVSKKLTKFNAYSPMTKKTYLAQCTSRFTRDENNWRYREISCSSGTGMKAKIVQYSRMY